MRITRIDIKGFGRFTEHSFSPAPGMNLIWGPNESGKSTLLAFIQAMLYGLRSGRRTRDGEMSALRRHEPWSGGPYQGVLHYELANGESYRVGRNFAKGTVHLHDAHHNDISARFPLDRETGPLFAETQFGVDTETFASTYLMNQQHAALDAGARKGLMDRLVRLQESGRDERGFRQAESALQQALLERVGSARSTVRPMDRILERLDKVARDVAAARALREESRTMAMALLAEKERISRLEDQVAQLQAERTSCRKAVRAAERMERLQRDVAARERLVAVDQRMGMLRREEALLQERCRANRGLSGLDEAGLADLSYQLGRLQERRRLLAQVEEEIARNREAAALLPRHLTRTRSPLPMPAHIALSAGLLLLAGISFLLWAGSRFSTGQIPPGLHAALLQVPGTVSVLFPVIGCLLLLLAGVAAWPLFTRRSAAPQGNLDRLAGKRQEAARDIQDMEAHVREVFSQAGLPEGGSEQARFEQLRLAVAQFQSDSARLAENGMRQEALDSERVSLMHMRSALSGDGESGFEEEFDRISGEEFDRISGEAVLPDASAIASIREAAAQARSRMPDLAEQLDAASETLAAARSRCAALEARLERVPNEDRLQQLLEEQSRLMVRKASLEAYGEALGIALEELRASALHLQQGVAPQLDTHAGEVLRSVTEGRYSGMGTDDRLSVRVDMPGTANRPSVSLLSGGTSAAAWLAIRLAAIRMLEGGRETLPLFLDEPFAHFDEARTAAALRCLRDTAGERQIFLFACRERDRNLVREIFAGHDHLEHTL